MRTASTMRRTLVITATIVAGAVSVLAGQRLLASDHQDTPEVELGPRMDINDVYAFPGSSAGRVVLVMTTSSPIAGQNASFDPDLLYQFKIDNTGDAVEDRVIQLTFDGGSGTAQRFTLRGPVAPAMAGTKSTLVPGATLSGNVGSAEGSASNIQVFAGLRADPFVIDLEQFFNIIPDRRPATGPLATPLTPSATEFRTPGVDLLRPFNALAIVVELPATMLTSGTTADTKFGVWGTISR